MQTKHILLMVLVLLAAFLFINKPATEQVQNKNIQAEVVSKNENSTAEDKISTVKPDDVIEKPSDTASEPETNVLSDITFSPDPVVNTHTIFRNNQLCYSQLENSNSKSIYMQQFLERMDKKQAKYFEQFVEYCKKLNLEHPEYSLTDKNHIVSQLKSAKPNSLWGKILSKEIEVDSLTDIEITGLLKSNDVNILQEAPQYLISHYQEVIHWDLESVLGNHDYDYINYIQQYAHQLYLCDLGAPCQANSTIMASLCYRDVTSCGLDFTSYVKNSLTQGQQADIQLAQSYLSSQYQ